MIDNAAEKLRLVLIFFLSVSWWPVMAVSFCTLSLLDLSTMSVFADGLHAKRRVLCPFLRFQSLVPSFTALYSFIHWKLYNERKGGRAPGLLSPHIYPAPFSLNIQLPVVSYLALSVRLTVKQVRRTNVLCNMIGQWYLKGQSNDAIHLYRYVITNTTEERLLKRALHTWSLSFNMTQTETSKKIDPD